MHGDKAGDIVQSWAAYQVDYAMRIDLVLRRRITGMSTAFAKPVMFELVEYDEHKRPYVEPTLSMKTEEAKQLMQALWDAGVRPESGNGSGAQVEALQAHIAFAEHVSKALLTERALPPIQQAQRDF